MHDSTSIVSSNPLPTSKYIEVAQSSARGALEARTQHMPQPGQEKMHQAVQSDHGCLQVHFVMHIVQLCVQACVLASQCEQVCLASSELLNTHLALAGKRLSIVIV